MGSCKGSGEGYLVPNPGVGRRKCTQRVLQQEKRGQVGARQIGGDMGGFSGVVCAFPECFGVCLLMLEKNRAYKRNQQILLPPDLANSSTQSKRVLLFARGKEG